jgi:hypothetical protein
MHCLQYALNAHAANFAGIHSVESKIPTMFALLVELGASKSGNFAHGHKVVERQFE